jgi:hypothetical protein
MGASAAMRSVLAILAFVAIWPATDAAAADPYRWCAEYGSDLGGSSSCYFLTLEQCQAAISGNGGFCRRNNFYSGPDANAAPARHRARR